MKDIKNEVCIITGAGSGIGRSLAYLMACEGVKVILIGKTRSKLEIVKTELEAIGGESLVFDLDVANYQDVRNMVKSVLEKYKKINILVNSAGHSSFHRSLLTTTPAEIQSVFGTNILGVIFSCQAVVPCMLDAKDGLIINVSSIAGKRPGILPGMAYSAAKAALINLTEYLNSEFRNTGIRATVVIPGEVDTPQLDKRIIPPSQNERSLMVEPKEVGELIMHIAKLQGKTTIPEVIIRPTRFRSFKDEIV